MHNYFPRRAQAASRRAFHAPAARYAPTAWRFRYGRVQTPRGVRTARGSFAIPHRGRVAAFRPSYGRRLASRSVRFAAARRDRTIRNYVGPRSAYAPVSSGIQVGSASFYGGRSHTASGGFVGAATCAHRSLPFGTRVLVTNLANARQAILTVNDRGPFVAGRIVDVSTGAAGILGMLHSGTAPVRVQVVGGPG